MDWSALIAGFAGRAAQLAARGASIALTALFTKLAITPADGQIETLAAGAGVVVTIALDILIHKLRSKATK